VRVGLLLRRHDPASPRMQTKRTGKIYLNAFLSLPKKPPLFSLAGAELEAVWPFEAADFFGPPSACTRALAADASCILAWCAASSVARLQRRKPSFIDREEDELSGVEAHQVDVGARIGRDPVLCLGIDAAALDEEVDVVASGLVGAVDGLIRGLLGAWRTR
jgi:hypothetical protein